MENKTFYSKWSNACEKAVMSIIATSDEEEADAAIEAAKELLATAYQLKGIACSTCDGRGELTDKEMPRDPRVDPEEGDILYNSDKTRKIFVDKIEVAYRIMDCRGGLIGKYRSPLATWRAHRDLDRPAGP
jgi:hypothetical protein